MSKKHYWCGEREPEARQPSVGEVEEYFEEMRNCLDPHHDEVTVIADAYQDGLNGAAVVEVTTYYEIPWSDIPGCQVNTEG